MSNPQTELSAQAAADALEKALRGHTSDLTVADAATRAGLSLRAAEKGLFLLLERYPSSLKATSEGQLLFRFDNGLTRLRKELSPARRLWKKLSRGLLGVGRFVLRAWISVVMVGYAALFIGILLALAFSGRSSSDDNKGIGLELVYVLLRVISEALFWTFHPFSPFSVHYRSEPVARGRRGSRSHDVPFYEKVNRFVFGPQAPEPDPRAQEQQILAEIRALRGRIGVTDLMRVTGLPREVAEPMLARLMLDYEGEVDVSDEGGITYRFPALRKTAAPGETHSRPRPAWSERLSALPLTGNSAGMNLLIAALNGITLLGSLVGIGAGLTLDKLQMMLEGVHPALVALETGTPLVLGWIPFVFSLALYAMPIARAFAQPGKKRKVARENGRRAILRSVLEKLGRAAGPAAGEAAFGRIEERALRQAWQQATGKAPSEAELVRQAVALGGDIEVDEASGRSYFRFRDLEAELAALRAERSAASDVEGHVGEVVFAAEESPAPRRG